MTTDQCSQFFLLLVFIDFLVDHLVRGLPLWEFCPLSLVYFFAMMGSTGTRRGRHSGLAMMPVDESHCIL